MKLLIFKVMYETYCYGNGFLNTLDND